MAELERINRQWTFEVTLNEGDAPDVLKQYTTRTIYRPDNFSFMVIMSEGDIIPKFREGSVAGNRVVKSGLGERVHEHIYPIADLRMRFPWLDPYVEQALELAVKDLNGIS